VHAEERRQAVEVALAVLVPDVGALAAHDDGQLVVLVGAHAREVHPEVLAGELLQFALRAGHRGRRGLELRRHPSLPFLGSAYPIWTTLATPRRRINRSGGESPPSNAVQVVQARRACFGSSAY